MLFEGGKLVIFFCWAFLRSQKVGNRTTLVSRTDTAMSSKADAIWSPEDLGRRWLVQPEGLRLRGFQELLPFVLSGDPSTLKLRGTKNGGGGEEGKRDLTVELGFGSRALSDKCTR